MAVTTTEVPAEGAFTPVDVEKLLDELRRPERLRRQAPTRSRPCRCDHPIGAPDEWVAGWVRCVLCGRDMAP